MDYILPEFLVKALKKPNERTHMESSIVGILVMMLGSMGIVSYMIINGVVTGFWFTLFMIASELGILSFQFSLLSTTYQQYYMYKSEMGLYPEDYVLKMKIKEAKDINNKLSSLIETIESKGGNKNVR